MNGAQRTVSNKASSSIDDIANGDSASPFADAASVALVQWLCAKLQPCLAKKLRPVSPTLFSDVGSMANPASTSDISTPGVDKSNCDLNANIRQWLDHKKWAYVRKFFSDVSVSASFFGANRNGQGNTLEMRGSSSFPLWRPKERNW
jgi:hypothetical protein